MIGDFDDYEPTTHDTPEAVLAAALVEVLGVEVSCALPAVFARDLPDERAVRGTRAHRRRAAGRRPEDERD